MGARPEVSAALRAPDFIAALQRASWPGNVRELRNFLERCVVFQQQLPLDEAQRSPRSYSEARQQAVDAFEHRYLEELMARHGGKVAAAAQEAGVGRGYLYRLLHRHGLAPTQRPAE
jgi:DNA-binding NtrC family response regulator